MECFIPLSSTDAIATASPSVFQIALPQRITVGTDFEIGLREISYPGELYTLVTAKDSEIKICFFNANEVWEEVVMCLPRKCYHTIENFIETINEFVSDYTTDITIKLSDPNTVYVAAHRGEIYFSPLIAAILGLREQNVIRSGTYSKAAPNLNQQQNFINICVDIVRPLYFNRKSWGLLRRIQHDCVGKKYILKTFADPLYFPVVRNDFDSITVHISNDHGNPVSFDCGSVFLLLHLRRRSPQDKK